MRTKKRRKEKEKKLEQKKERYKNLVFETRAFLRTGECYYGYLFYYFHCFLQIFLNIRTIQEQLSLDFGEEIKKNRASF